MSKEQDFLDRWETERPAYEAWGRLISQTVKDQLVPVLDAVTPDYFLRAPVAPRTKNEQKLIEKAFYRNKSYANPYEDITDKIGTRFVVLLGSDIRIVEGVLTSIGGWIRSRDRDYEEEQKKNPLKFDYAAVHYVVRPEADVEHEGVWIPAGTPCEVQIKTILQHAYSELTHDTIYKPQIEATSVMQRNAAKAMALLEATNDYFEKVAEDVNHALSNVRQMTADLSNLYRKAVGLDPKPTVLEGLLLAAYESSGDRVEMSDIETFLSENSFIPQRIRDHIGEKNPIFNQPSVLLVYMLARRSTRRAIDAWPLTHAEMEPLLNDLGESIN